MTRSLPREHYHVALLEAGRIGYVALAAEIGWIRPSFELPTTPDGRDETWLELDQPLAVGEKGGGDNR